jgi:hypothetical protein
MVWSANYEEPHYENFLQLPVAVSVVCPDVSLIILLSILTHNLCSLLNVSHQIPNHPGKITNTHIIFREQGDITL